MRIQRSKDLRPQNRTRILQNSATSEFVGGAATIDSLCSAVKVQRCKREGGREKEKDHARVPVRARA